jgi:hypothetical protein
MNDNVGHSLSLFVSKQRRVGAGWVDSDVARDKEAVGLAYHWFLMSSL